MRSRRYLRDTKEISRRPRRDISIFIKVYMLSIILWNAINSSGRLGGHIHFRSENDMS